MTELGLLVLYGPRGRRRRADLRGIQADRCRYLHVDFDAFAPELAPGISDEPFRGGLTLKQAQTIKFAVGDNPATQ